MQLKKSPEGRVIYNTHFLIYWLGWISTHNCLLMSKINDDIDWTRHKVEILKYLLDKYLCVSNFPLKTWYVPGEPKLEEIWR